MDLIGNKIGKYSVEDTFWLDEDTFVLLTDTFTDGDGDEYHLEVEWHKDEGYERDSIHFIAAYEYEALMGDEFDCLNLTHGYVTYDERNEFIELIEEVMENEKK